MGLSKRQVRHSVREDIWKCPLQHLGVKGHISATDKWFRKKIYKVPNKDFLYLLIYLSLMWALSKEGVGVRSPHTAVQGCLEKKPTHIALRHWV